ncbi:MAG: methionyl-tRNA formyltransferase [Flavobacteriales bacterium]|nr:methionyl-tRNA formyltransferase [Flavobacteriales bacterium]MBL0045675.1 methionyl-tRNA formyltransferase [Flavobacteriales bacterium]
MSAQRIVFMGTPAFAVASLDALVRAGIDVAAVVTAPDRPAGRGQHLRMSAVKEFALANGILKDRILQPEKLKDPTFHAQLDATGASLYVVVAFRMLPELVWNRPPLGTINLHASMLPDYRGAAPINWAVMNGETRTGVTTFFIRHEIDTGDILLREETPIGPEETAGELHDRLMIIGASLLVRTVQEVLGGRSKSTSQSMESAAELHHAPKLTPESCRIDWHSGVQTVHDHIRGSSPFPGAWSQLVIGDQDPQHFKILKSRVAYRTSDGEAGTANVRGGQFLVRCADGAIEALEIQAEGKRRMDAQSFLRGFHSLPTFRFT